jgi:cbb3-type cytochrome oxidase maturation protein
MNILYLLVPAALMLAALGVAGFVWSVRSGQFDDVETPGMRVLFDDEDPKRPSQHLKDSQEERH